MQWATHGLAATLTEKLTAPLSQDFESVEAAQDVFEAGLDIPFTLDGDLLRLDYSHNPPPAAAQAALDQGPSDWLCDMCQAVNFSRQCISSHLPLGPPPHQAGPLGWET